MRKEFKDISQEFKEYLFFYGGFLSNWHNTRFVDMNTGISYNCSEQYMMHRKALLFEDYESARLILSSLSPWEQKDLGRKVKNFNESKWQESARAIVYEGCYYKFTQNKDLGLYLQSTKGKLLVEASPTDKIWGIGLSMEDKSKESPSAWRGTNWLGQVLTHLRLDLYE